MSLEGMWLRTNACVEAQERSSFFRILKSSSDCSYKFEEVMVSGELVVPRHDSCQ